MYPQKRLLGKVHWTHLFSQALTLWYHLANSTQAVQTALTHQRVKLLNVFDPLCVSVDAVLRTNGAKRCAAAQAALPQGRCQCQREQNSNMGGPTSWRLHHSCEHIWLDSVSGSPGFSWLYCFHPSRPITSLQLNKQGHRRGRAALGGCGVQKVSALLCCQQITIKIKMPERDGWSGGEPLCCWLQQYT